ncbi:MAG: MBOAT family protein [Proteobacteria bacterium]|nr:MAG: MBOAT family protein [Pseudomonadota bacterium]
MVFSSAIFLFLFLPVVLIAYLAAGRVVARNAVLLGASLFFYAWGEEGYLLVLLVSVFINHRLGLGIHRAAGRGRTLLLGTAVGLNLLLLGYYKYANFLVENINTLAPFLDLGAIDVDPVHLPLGISFFTFQAISYVVDIYRGQSEPQRSFFGVALYISMFPQLVAGPIVRYNTIEQTLSHRSLSIEGFADGSRRFLIGLAKKLLIANLVGQVADEIFSLPAGAISPAVAWFGVLCYAIQIYFDFSGYSDMAIGLGRMFGFTYPENFNFPYISRSVQEFWRRWHMTLSNWFRDYVYIPLGGNRCARPRVYFNLVVVFLLTGLWHGASWNFVAWGFYHGAFLVLERLGLGRLLERLPNLVSHAYLIAVILVSWVFFRAEDLPTALEYLGAMLAMNEQTPFDNVLLHADARVWLALGAGVCFSMPVAPRLRNLARRVETGTARATLVLCGDVMLLLLLWLCALEIAGGTYNPFIYFRF